MTLNQDLYDEARKRVDGLNTWHEHKLLILSVIDRAIHLEREVERLSIPTNQGESTRLREALKKISKKVAEHCTLIFSAHINKIASEALSSHKEIMTTWMHNCHEVDDMYGFQVVAKGKQCPFCGLTEVSHDPT